MVLTALRRGRVLSSRVQVAAVTGWRGLAGGGDGAGRSDGSGKPPKPKVIRIDRSGLMPAYEPHSHGEADLVHKEPESEIVRHLKALIRFRGGPITLAEYMSEVLTNPTAGYYTQRDVFGVAGDFVTSPEISQMFGEMVGIWCVAAWQAMGQPPALRLVELGPGRGTLLADLLRGTAAFPAFSQALSVALVEVSPVLRQRQWAALRCDGEWREERTSATSGLNGAKVTWHRSLEEVEQGPPTLYIAHEFVDALPVHQFQRTERGWCERLVDIASPDSPLHLRMVLSPGPTPAARVLLPRRLAQLSLRQRAATSAIEVCPQGMATAEALARRVAAEGGAALLIDYGREEPYSSSLAAIRQHKFVGLLDQPGSADLSAHVDFSALRAAALGTGEPAACYGPMPQGDFLLSLGMGSRLEALIEHAGSEAAADALVAGFERLVGSGMQPGSHGGEGMGQSYKAFCIAPARAAPPFPFLPPAAEGEGTTTGEPPAGVSLDDTTDRAPKH